MKRSKKIVLTSHCILNVNSKIEGLAMFPAGSEIVTDLIKAGYGIIQLPCVEQAVLGTRRWGTVHSQCNYPGFRARCRELLLPVVDQVEDFVSSGYEVRAVIGVDGSPTCGVNIRPEGNWGGEVGYEYGIDEKISSLRTETGPGTMIEILMEMFAERSLEIPFCAVNEAADDRSLDELLNAEVSE